MKDGYWQKHYECDCGAHIVVTGHPYKDYPSEHEVMDMALFSYGGGDRYPLSIRERLRWVWHILKTGTPFTDTVVLNKGVAKKLATDLLEWVKVPVY